MRYRSRALLALIAAMLAAPLVASPPPEKVSVQVTVTGLRSSQGLVQACLTAEPKSFPDCQNDPAAVAMTVPAGDAKRLDFGTVAPGRYAIALLHDENGNGKMDRALLIPTEGFGFSRDAKLRMGPPTFAAAAFVVEKAAVRQSIRMRYLL